MNKTFRMLLTAVSSIALAFGFAVSPASAAPSPSTLYAGGPAGSTTDCTGPIGLYSDSAHTVSVTAITGGGSASFQNDCTSTAVYVKFGSSFSSVSGSLFFRSGIARNTASLSFTSSATFYMYICAPDANEAGSPSNCTNADTRVLEVEIPLTVSGGGSSGGGGVSIQGLYPLGGASVTGNLTLNSVLTATNGTWSLSSGGAAVTPDTMSYNWFVCDASDSNSTDIMNSGTNPACLSAMNDPRVLADGNSVGTSGSSYNSATLTLNQSLMTALNGKYLAVAVRSTKGSAFGNLLLPTCGAIGTATSCSVAYGTTPPVVTPAAKPAQALAKALPKTAKAGKAVTVAAATKSKVAVKVSVSGKGCKVTPVKDKKKKIVSYSVTMGKKGVTCTVTVTAPATSKVAALKSVTKIKAS